MLQRHMYERIQKHALEATAKMMQQHPYALGDLSTAPATYAATGLDFGTSVRT